MNHPKTRLAIPIAFSLGHLSSSGQPVQTHQHQIQFGTLTVVGFDSPTLRQAGEQLKQSLPLGRKPSMTIRSSALFRLGEELSRETAPTSLPQAELYDDHVRHPTIKLAIGYLLAALEAAQPGIIATSGDKTLAMAAQAEPDLVTIQFMRNESVATPKPATAKQALTRGQMSFRRRDPILRT